EPPIPQALIPQAAESMAIRRRRMPASDEVRGPAQAELRARHGEDIDSDHPEKRKLGLLRRLAAVGLGRREEHEELEEIPATARPPRPAPSPRPAAPRPADARLGDRPTDQEAARRP